MKKAFKIASVYIGLVIGAGFASGREVLEYFNFRSNTNICGILLASFLFMTIAYMILSKASEDGIYDYSDYIDSIAGRLSPCVKGFMLIYMFCGLFVMFAGSGALAYSVSPLSSFWGCLLMALICFFVISFDLKGIVTLNLILVPLMVCGIIFVTVTSAVFDTAQTASIYTNGGIMLSAVCYASYNTVTAGAVLVPLAKNTNTKIIRAAAVGGGFVIGLLIMLVWTVMGINFDMLYDSELPMLELSALIGKMSKRIYTAVLFMAICTTAVSYGFGIISYFSDRLRCRRDRILFAAVLCLAALPFSLYGFSTLVSNLYSVLGYIGMIWIIMTVFDRLR